jgi:hypothetical protein
MTLLLKALLINEFSLKQVVEKLCVYLRNSVHIVATVVYYMVVLHVW